MPKCKTEFQIAVGKLISANKKEWREELGESTAEYSENVMNSVHDLLQAGTPEKARELLGPMTLRQFLGESWIKKHPNVTNAISAVESHLSNHNT